MFQKAELARLQARKELLVLESSANRLLLAAEWQRLRSPEHWRDEAGRLVRRLEGGEQIGRGRFRGLHNCRPHPTCTEDD